ncbi:MAG: glycosyltransferase family 4 protein [Bacteroidetes bacterium]|nr:glycosyltransferase family 4 protein [Bacteroidota bacterium]
MKILQLNTYDQKGGAARATYRLSKSLADIGADIRLLVRKKSFADSFTYAANEKFSSAKAYFDYLPTLLFTRKRLPFFSAIINDNLLENVALFRPDIIHLNWISEGFVKIETLAKLNVPIVWTLHDSWSFTGGCHIPKGCLKYQTKCERCPYLSPKFKNDLSSYNFERKLKAYAQIDIMQIVTPSNWMRSEVVSSTLLKGRNVAVIPNCLDTDFYDGVNKEIAKSELRISPENRVIIFGGINSTKDENKGFQFLLNALETVTTKDVVLIVFGNDKPKVQYENGIEIKYLGKINNDEKLRTIYSAGDVTVVPSIQEVFGQVIIESMSCGTPVVAFNQTGPAEIIQHKKNGFLANPFEEGDLAKGIDWVLENQSRWEMLSANAVTFVRAHYSSEIIARKYIELFKRVLGNK